MAIETEAATAEQRLRLSLDTSAARNLATTTKTTPQMQGITSRWLLRMLPWVQVAGGTYRVNRRLSYAVGRGRVGFAKTGAEVRVVPPSLRELPMLRDVADEAALNAIAERFVQREVGPGELLALAGQPVEEIILVAHGKVNQLGEGKYGDEIVLGVLADGDHLGERELAQAGSVWGFTARAITPCTVLAMPRQTLQALGDRFELLRDDAGAVHSNGRRPQDKHGQAAIDLAAGHEGEVELPGTFVDYEVSPREYQLSVAQTILRVHTRVADLYNEPMNQVEQQLRLTIEELRERQEHELVNNREFGLLHNAEYDQRINTHSGPPTPDDLDELLSRRRSSRVMLAHPRAIAAFGRECTRRGVYPSTVDVQGSTVPAWRGVPILPCNKIPVSEAQTTSIIVMRTGEDDQGVVGLHQTGIPDEYQPSLNVRFMGINEKAVLSYLVSVYFSVAVLVPDALGILENVEIARVSDRVA
jgi:hypothetical protein